jgi:hypothetical protein
MKKLKDTELIDLLDEKMEAKTLHESDAAALEDMKLAMMALQAWDEAEPIEAGENFWPKLREKLPARPPRSPMRRAASTLGAWLAQSPLAASMRVAMLAAILALASFWFAAPNQRTPAVAVDSFTTEEKAFIKRSLQKHDNYVATQPDGNGVSIPAGDASTTDAGDDEPQSEYVP